MPQISQPQLKGELYAISLTLIDGWFPILALLSVQALGAIYTYFYSLTIAAMLLFFLLWQRKQLSELKRSAAYFNLFMVSLTITSLYILVFLSLKFTTPNHVALILFLQVLFAYLFFGRRQEEQLNRVHLVGVILMTLGAVIVLFPKDFHLNIGDGLVLLASLIAPLANHYQKQARKQVSPMSILFVRSLLALPFLYLLAVWLEPQPTLQLLWQQLPWLFLIGALAFVVGKILWIEAIHLLPITKVNALYAFAPIFTMLLSYWLLNQPPTLNQVLGALPILLGSYFITRPQTAKMPISTPNKE